jgi:hypothetical protein
LYGSYEVTRKEHKLQNVLNVVEVKLAAIFWGTAEDDLPNCHRHLPGIRLTALSVVERSPFIVSVCQNLAIQLSIMATRLAANVLCSKSVRGFQALQATDVGIVVSSHICPLKKGGCCNNQEELQLPKVVNPNSS